jgi:cytochrome c oxidase assembly protein subunit 15
MSTAALVERKHGTRSVARFAWVVVGYFIFVVLLGAVVRATDSGGGCGASWPLCNGDFFPHHPRLATVIEFTHRSTSGVCTVLLIGLAVWTFLTTTKGHRARKAVSWAGFFLVTEALLGAALVLKHWVEANVSTGRTIAQSIHFTNTLLLMAALALTAWFLRDESQDFVGSRVSGLRNIKAAAWLAVAATIVVGATGALAALADTLFPSPTLSAGMAEDFAANAPVLVRMRWLHPAAALVGLVCVALLVRAAIRTRGGWDGVSKSVVSLLGLQFVLGSADVLLLAPTWLQVVHLLGADLYWVALVVMVGGVLWPDAANAANPPQTEGALSEVGHPIGVR